MTDTEFMKATDKELVLRQWRIFVKKLLEADLDQLVGADYGPFPASLDKPFTDRLYKHLSLHCGFIAHFNRRGFLSARFGSAEAICETLGMLDGAIPYPGFRDLNEAMKAELNGLRNQLLSR